MLILKASTGLRTSSATLIESKSMNYKTLLLLILAFYVHFVSAAELGELDAGQLAALQHDQNALIVDIRTEQEWAATGTIPDSRKLEFFNAEGQSDTKQWVDKLNKLRTSPDQPVVLVCRSGNRSGRVGRLLAQKLGVENVYHLKNGILPWIKAGNPIAKVCSDHSAC